MYIWVLTLDMDDEPDDLIGAYGSLEAARYAMKMHQREAGASARRADEYTVRQTVLEN